MKTIKYILSVWAILSLSLFCYSCMEEEVPKNDENWSDGKTVRLTLSAPQNRIVSPMTKSAQADTTLTDLNVLIYENGRLTHGFYYADGNDVVATLQKGGTKKLDLELGPNAKGTIYAVANHGSDISKVLTFNEETALNNAQFNLNGGQPQKYMYAEGGQFDVSDPNQNKKQLELTRIYALVTVKVVKNLAQPAGGRFDVVPTSLQIKNIPIKGQFASGNLITKSSESMVEGETLLAPEGDNNFLSKDHNAAQAFYLYENRQPVGSSLNDNTDQTTKTPAGMPADEISAIIKTNRTCSYIEMKAKYIRNGNPEGVGSGTIIHRFFLGKDVVKDFDVERNVHYQVTLTLNGKGGADEATWRVETELIGEVQAPDVYVGYRSGSKTRMYITGTGVSYIENVSSEVTHTPTGGDPSNFKVTKVATDEHGSYVEIEAAVSNAHDYDKKTGKITFHVNGNGVTRDFTAKVYQVPRLVDPIAFYKKADNTTPVHIRVKEFDPNKRSYIDLNSKGPWTATIKYSNGSSNNWYKIYETDERGAEISGSAVSVVDGVIHGEGPVQFGYQPLSENTNADGDGGKVDAARYGMILVKYHNDWCEHEIYLRQGYQPTTMGDSKYAWSMFNCLGEDKDGARAVTSYPTQTGWLFNGGVDIAMHPFKPGYGVSAPLDLVYSNGDKGYGFQKYKGSPDAWGKISNPESEYTETAPDGTQKKNPERMEWAVLQGPCPEGYGVATAPTYRALTHSSEVYTGYVHDDDPIAGWRYGASPKGAEIDDDNHCNPAKGSLFITKDKSTNVFFNYGKGVYTGAAAPLIPEIGAGHRYDGEDGNRFPELTSEYSGFYWNGTSFACVPAYYEIPGGGDHMGKVHFQYNIFSKEPTLIDVPGFDAAIGGAKAIGIDRFHNGSFVRCVKDPDYVKMVWHEIEIGGTFSTCNESTWGEMMGGGQHREVPMAGTVTLTLYKAGYSEKIGQTTFEVANGVSKEKKARIKLPESVSVADSMVFSFGHAEYKPKLAKDQLKANNKKMFHTNSSRYTIDLY